MLHPSAGKRIGQWAWKRGWDQPQYLRSDPKSIPNQHSIKLGCVDLSQQFHWHKIGVLPRDGWGITRGKEINITLLHIVWKASVNLHQIQHKSLGLCVPVKVRMGTSKSTD